MSEPPLQESVRLPEILENGRPGRVPADRGRQRTRILLFSVQILVVAAIVVSWVASPSVRASKSLWVLFWYAFPAQFLLAPVPHEPLLLYFSKFYSPLTVAGVSVVGTLLAEVGNYSILTYAADLDFSRKFLRGRSVTRLVGWFDRAPFPTLCVAGFLPVPFYPFRFLSAISGYPAWKFLLAVFASRTPRFWLLCLLGAAVRFPDWMIILVGVALAAVAIVPATKAVWDRKNRTRGNGR